MCARKADAGIAQQHRTCDADLISARSHTIMADDPNFVANPFITFAKRPFRATRLVNFPTGKADLAIPHQNWLVSVAVAIPPNRNYRIYIVGFASQLGYA